MELELSWERIIRRKYGAFSRCDARKNPGIANRFKDSLIPGVWGSGLNSTGDGLVTRAADKDEGNGDKSRARDESLHGSPSFRWSI